MKSFGKILTKLVRDEQGGEVIEYALVVSLIILAALTTMNAVGSKVLARWTSIVNSL